MTSNTPQVTVTEAEKVAIAAWDDLRLIGAKFWHELNGVEQSIAIAAAQRGIEQGRADERAAIVEWHREWDEDAADFIAAGRHLTTKDAT